MLLIKFLTTCFEGPKSMELGGFFFSFCASKWACDHLNELGLSEITFQYNLVQKHASN